MARSQTSSNKKEKEKKRLEKRQVKQQKAEGRKSAGTSSMDDMIAYVDEFGRITDTMPDPKSKQVIDIENIEVSVRKREDVYVDPIHNGKVDVFNTSRGFGFISETGSGERYFVHASNLLEPISEGDKVSFEVEQGPKGLMAVRVKIQQQPKAQPAVVVVEEPLVEAQEAAAKEPLSE
jgi:cold shock CspA family protein